MIMDVNTIDTIDAINSDNQKMEKAIKLQDEALLYLEKSLQLETIDEGELSKAYFDHYDVLACRAELLMEEISRPQR